MRVELSCKATLATMLFAQRVILQAVGRLSYLQQSLIWMGYFGLLTAFLACGVDLVDQPLVF